jgi:hypothetical protein
MSHPTDDEIELFLAARLDPARQQNVVRHLLAGCGTCSRKLMAQAPSRILDEVEAGGRHKTGPRSPRNQAVASALRRDTRWRLDEQKLTRSLELLRTQPPGFDNVTAQQVNGLQGTPLVEALLQRSFEFRYRDVRKMKLLAYSAMKAAESPEAEVYGSLFHFDLQARTWADLGNSFRLNDQLAEAEVAMRRMRSLLRQGSGDHLLLANLAEREAALEMSRRRLRNAHEILDRAYRLYVKLGDAHSAGRTLISKGLNLTYGNHFHLALKAHQEGLSLIDSRKESELSLGGTQNVIDTLAKSGDHRRAGEALLKSGLRQAFVNDDLALLKLRWIEGGILGGTGNSSGASRALVEVRIHFLDLQQGYHAALVGLDLLPLWYRAGKGIRVRQMANDVYEELQGLGIHQEAAKAEPYLAG